MSLLIFYFVLGILAQSNPTPGQFHRFRAQPENSLLSITPVDGAEFLLDQYFDISIELHNEGNEYPDISHLKASINGQPMPLFLNSTFSPKENWNFSYFKDALARDDKISTHVSVSRMAMRSVSIKKSGVLDVTVQIGSNIIKAKWTVRTSGSKKVKNLILFIGDGMAPTMISAARYISRKTVEFFL